MKEKTYYMRKCIDIFNENDRWSFIPVVDLKKFVKTNLGIYLKSNMKKAEVISTVKSILCVDTLPVFYKLYNFGLIINDIAEIFNISQYMARKIVSENQIRIIGEHTYSERYIRCNIYSIEDIVEYAVKHDIKPKRHKRVAEVENTPENLAKALYVINKSAKKSRDTKKNSYDKHDYRICNGAKTRSYNLYSLKNVVMKRMIDEGHMVFVGTHRQEVNNNTVYLDLYKCGDFTFHNPHLGEIDSSQILQDVITDKISADVTRKVPITYTQAINLLKGYAGINQ